MIFGLAALSDDTEGRVITAEFDKFFVVVTYVPNAGEGLRRLVSEILFTFFADPFFADLVTLISVFINVGNK